jgi:hypothetical protein
MARNFITKTVIVTAILSRHEAWTLDMTETFIEAFETTR